MRSPFSIPWGNWASRICWGPFANVSSIGVHYRYYFNGFYWEPWQSDSGRYLPHDPFRLTFFTPVSWRTPALGSFVLIIFVTSFNCNANTGLFYCILLPFPLSLRLSKLSWRARLFSSSDLSYWGWGYTRSSKSVHSSASPTYPSSDNPKVKPARLTKSQKATIGPEETQQVITGLMLGDGSIAFLKGSGRGNARLVIGFKDKDFTYHIWNLLNSIGGRRGRTLLFYLL